LRRTWLTDRGDAGAVEAMLASRTLKAPPPNLMEYEMSDQNRPTFSPETKLIVASNIAVAEAIWRLIRKDDRGQPFEDDAELVRTSIGTALRNFDALVAKNFPAPH
jgi:hypothetical protein